MEKTIDLFIGIDPSINSTGITVLEYHSFLDKYNFIKKTFYIVKDKITKNEKSIIENYKKTNSDFNVITYNKKQINSSVNSSDKELSKTLNLISIVDSVKNIISNYIKNLNIDSNIENIHVTITMEANSYGSSGRTVSIIELAGLNYLLRNSIIEISKNTYIIYNKKRINVLFDLFIEPPTVIKKFATTRGDADKDLMIYCFALKNEKLYNSLNKIKLDDISDSYFMAYYGLVGTYKISLIELYNIEQSKNLSNKLKEYKDTKSDIKITTKIKKQEKQNSINNLQNSDLEFINSI